MPALNLNGRALHYSDHQPQQELTLLLIHGAGGSRAVWPQAVTCHPHARVISLDLPGHGRSAPPGRRSTNHYASVIEAVVNALDLRDLVIVGHSMGSAIALSATHRGVVTVRGLILMGAGARLPVGDLLLGGLIADIERAAEFIVDQGFASAPAEVRNAVRQEILTTGASTTFGDFLACSRFDLRTQLSTIGVPTLVIAGELDRLTPLRFSQSLVSGLPRARLSILEGAGHFTMLDQPDSVAALTTGFLDGLGHAA